MIHARIPATPHHPSGDRDAAIHHVYPTFYIDWNSLMKTLIAIFAFTALTLTASATLLPINVNSASPEGAEQFKDVTLGGAVYNSCCNEWVNISGTGHVVIRNGSFSSSHVNIKGMTGIGENGREYTQKASATQNLNTENGTQLFQIKMTGPDGCSFTYHLVIQIHTNANGDITAEKVSESITCE
jgi:hypothetical protein